LAIQGRKEFVANRKRSGAWLNGDLDPISEEIVALLEIGLQQEVR